MQSSMGDKLREAATIGDIEVIKSILKGKGNPCSTDQYGLSPLMYAGEFVHSKWTPRRMPI